MNCNFLGYPCSMQFDKYRNTGNIAIQLAINDPEGALSDVFHGEPVCVATVNLMQLPADRIAVKNWSENTGMVESLVEAGFIDPDPCDHIESGFVSVPVHKLTPAALAEIRTTGGV